MKALSPDLEPILRNWSQTLGTVTGLRPLNAPASGLLVETSGGRRYVLKAVEGHPFAGHTAGRLALLHYLREQGLPVAAPLAVDGQPETFLAGDAGRRYWLSPHLSGNPDPPAPFDWARRYAAAGAAIARLQRVLAGYRGPLPAPRMDLVRDALRVDLPLLRQNLLPAEQPAFERAAGYLAQRLPGRLAGLPSQIIHGNCHAGSILWDGEQVSGFVDLDHLPWGPRVYDLGCFLAGMARKHIEQLGEIAAWFGGLGPFIGGYQAGLALDQAEITILPAVMMAAQVRLAAGFQRHNDPGRARSNLAALYWLEQQAGRIMAGLSQPGCGTI